MVKGYELELLSEDKMDEFIVKFNGPQDSPYAGVSSFLQFRASGKSESCCLTSTLSNLPPLASSTKFITLILTKCKPAFYCRSGSVCLDVINQQWSPMYDLVNIFEVFLPQLLLYPNPADPLNAEAAQLQMKSTEQYNQKVKSYVVKYASGSTQPQQVVPDHTQWHSNGIDQLSETSGIEMVEISDDETML